VIILMLMHGCFPCWPQAYQSVKPRVLDILDEIIGECANSRRGGGSGGGEMSRSLPPKSAAAAAAAAVGVAGDGADDSWRVYVTGHSMGGAHATLCAYELAVRTAFLYE
jgi:dienelactone hydrolase